MATVKVKFRPSTVADRPGSIVINVTRHRVARQITTGYKVFPCEWDEKQSRLVPTARSDRMAAVNSMAQRLSWDLERLRGIIERFDSRQRAYSVDDIVAEFQRTGKGNTFFIFMENVIVRLRQLGHTGTANNYRAALGSFKRFRTQEDIPIGAIDPAVMEDYQAYLNAAGLAPNSTSFYMRILRAVYNRAVEQELTIDRKPFRTVFTGTEKTLKRAVSISDIRRIKGLDLSHRPGLEFARDVFLFLFLYRRRLPEKVGCSERGTDLPASQDRPAAPCQSYKANRRTARALFHRRAAVPAPDYNRSRQGRAQTV